MSDPTILYHVFNEKPWHFPVNTGVKFVHRNVIFWEDEIYSKRKGCPFPFEQKLVIDYIVPTYGPKVKIHDPEILNCLYGTHRHEVALFVHVCSRSAVNRNLIILKNTRKLLHDFPDILDNQYYKNFYYYYLINYALKIIQAIMRLPSELWKYKTKSNKPKTISS